MSNDLFAAARQEKCRRLYALGWRQVGGLARGVQMWADPEGGHLTEDEAFKRLERTNPQPERPTNEQVP